MNPHLTLLLAYSAVLVAVGLWLGRRVGTPADFFVARRGLGPGLLLTTLLAANIGAGSTIGAAGLGYRDGLAGWWWVGSAGVGSLVLALWIGPRIWRLAERHDLMTVGDFLEWRYGSSVRIVVAVLLWLATVVILAGQLIALAWVLDVVAGIPKWAGCLTGGAVMTAYFTAGGLSGSARVNLLELAVLLAGFAVALPWIWGDAGGWEAVEAAAPGGRADWLDFWRGGGSGWTYMALLAPPFIVSPGLLQKVYGARDVRAVRLGVGLNALALLAFASVPPLLGMLARIHAPELENPELALPVLLTEALPAALGSLCLAAIFSAEISSADAILFMLATSLARDLYGRYLRPDAGDDRLLRVARGAAIGGGTLGVALAVVLPSVIESLTIFYSVLGVCLFVPVVAGLTTRRPGAAEALASVGAGLAVLIAARLAGASGFWNPSTLALIGSAAAFALVLALRASARRGR